MPVGLSRAEPAPLDQPLSERLIDGACVSDRTTTNWIEQRGFRSTTMAATFVLERVIDVSLTAGDQLADSIQHFRRRAGLNQRAAAELAGLSVGGLRDIEQGRVARPRASTLRKLADVFGLSRYEFDDLVRQANNEYRQAARLRVEILGSLRVSVDGTPVDPGSEAQHVLLGLLALTPNVSVTRGALLDALWDVRPAYGTANLLQSRVSAFGDAYSRASPTIPDHSRYR